MRRLLATCILGLTTAAFSYSGAAQTANSGVPNRKDSLKYVDQDQAFMLNEIVGDELFFQAVTRTGKTVDSGVLARQPKPKPVETPSQR